MNPELGLEVDFKVGLEGHHEVEQEVGPEVMAEVEQETGSLIAIQESTRET